MNRRRTNERLRRRTDLDKGLLNRGWHSKAYHRHFEGYAEVETTNAKGKTVIERVYVGQYHRLELPKKKRIQLRAGCFLLWMLMAAAFGFAASRPIGANRVWYMAIAQMLAVCALGYLLIKLLAHCTAPRCQTIGDWKSSSVALIRAGIWAFWLMGLTAVLTLLFLLLEGEEWGIHLLCIVLYGLAGLSSLAISRMEANAPYITFSSTEEAPEEGSYIDA